MSALYQQGTNTVDVSSIQARMTTQSLPDVLISIPDGVLDLSWGHPSPSLHALDAIREAAAD